MSIRIATRADIPELHIIRSSVTENVLTSIITEEMIIDVMEKYGRIWIYLNPPKNTPSIAVGLDGDEFGIVGEAPTIN